MNILEKLYEFVHVGEKTYLNISGMVELFEV